MIDVIDHPRSRQGLVGVGVVLLVWQLSPANPDTGFTCEDHPLHPPKSCGGCTTMDTYMFSPTPVLPCMNIPSLVLLVLLALWFVVCSLLGQIRNDARDPFRHPRDLLLNAFQLSIFGLILSVLDDQYIDGGSFGTAISSSIQLLAIYWNVLLVTAPFPSERWVQHSRSRAYTFAWINFLLLLLSQQDVTRAAIYETLYFVFNAWGLGTQLCKAWFLVPPSRTVLVDACKLLWGSRLDPNRKAGEQSAPGFLTAIAVALWLVQALGYSIQLILVSEW